MAESAAAGDHLEPLRQRYSFADWAGQSSLPESLVVIGFFLGASELPDWQRYRVERFDGAQTRRTQSTWTRAEGADELLRVDLLECPSRTVAHEALLHAIGEFQSAALARQQIGVGDIAFGNGDFAVVFARGNLVAMLRSAGRRLVPVVGVSRELDQRLTSRAAESRGVAPSIGRFEPESDEVAVGQPVPLRLEAADPLGRPVWFKVFAAGGDLRIEDGTPVYQADTPGSHQLTAFAVNENGGVATSVTSVRAS
jgi:hypothetical protein